MKYILYYILISVCLYIYIYNSGILIQIFLVLEKSKLIKNWLYQLKEFQFNTLYFILQRNNSSNNEEERSLTSKEFDLINNIHSLLFTVTNGL